MKRADLKVGGHYAYREWGNHHAQVEVTRLRPESQWSNSKSNVEVRFVAPQHNGYTTIIPLARLTEPWETYATRKAELAARQQAALDAQAARERVKYDERKALARKVADRGFNVVVSWKRHSRGADREFTVEVLGESGIEDGGSVSGGF